MTTTPAAAPTPADAALGTLASEPGGFGAALGGLGFGAHTEGDTWIGTRWLATDHDSQLIRVITWPTDGGRTEVIGFDPARPAARLEAWHMTFSGSTPQSIVLAAIANALGQLPVTR